MAQNKWGYIGVNCFAWSLGLVLEGSTPKIEDKQAPVIYLMTEIA